MDIVYLAEQTEPLCRRVALKVVKLGMDTKQVLARFNRERESLALMEHSNIARILDAGASSCGRPFFVMDFVDGTSITAYCDLHQMTTAQRLELFLPFCRVVQHAHNKGIIHRDIKPSNVLVAVEDSKPVVKVIDFGIARAINAGDAGQTLCTQFGEIVSTPEYASPEQADMVAGEVSTATDVYSLGVLLYEMLVGAVPFDGTLLRKAGAAEMLRIIREEEPASLVQRLSALDAGAKIAAHRGTDVVTLRKLLNGDLNWIVKKALEKSPQRRYVSPSELAADIERHLRGEPVLAGAPRPIPRFRKPLLAAVAALVLTSAAWLTKRAVTYKPLPKIASTVVLSDAANDTGDPSFDRSFRQSISFELQRSGNVKVLAERRIADTLSQMRRNHGTRLTPEIAREICLRTGSAAFVESSLSALGSSHLLTLRSRNCNSGESVDEEQQRAATKNEIANALRRLTVELESKSAASLTVLQKNAAPLDPATTSSLEALKSFTAARQRVYVSSADALLLFKRAVELDPQFALAYAWLGRAYADSGEQNLAMQSIREAYRLRNIVGDIENFFITYSYDREVLRSFELCRQLCQSWIAKYLWDRQPHAFLSGLTSQGTDQYGTSIEEGERAHHPTSWA